MKEEITIEQLRKAGFKVRVIHEEVKITDEHYDLADRITRIELRDLEGNEHVGIAKCSLKDRYDRKLGNKIALGRALQYVKNIPL